MSDVSAQAPEAAAGAPTAAATAGSVVELFPSLGGIPVAWSLGQEVLFPPAERWVETAETLRDGGFVTCVDLCGVDYLGYLERALADGVAHERFEVVANLLSHSLRRRVRLRLVLGGEPPVAPSLFFVYPGTENMEREAYDLFGIVFEGHPDLTRILMPQDWEGHPLRKDFSVGRVPVQFKEAPGRDDGPERHGDDAMTDEHDSDALPGALRTAAGSAGAGDAGERDDEVPEESVGDEDFEQLIEAETGEGPQELAPQSATSPIELLIEQGGVLRIPEDAVVDPDLADVELGPGETMIINLGPQHPSTHGVLRVMLELEGETVVRSKPIIGYLHTGMEKTAEELTYVQGATNVTRMDYLSPMNNEVCWSLAVEKLLDVEIPPRATWIRMLVSELNRISSHVMWAATNGMDLASTTMMIFGFRERELVLAFFEKLTGLRMNHNYVRPGGVAADLPDGWEDDVTVIVDTIGDRVEEYDDLLTGQPIFRERTEGVGIISAELALALSATGPILRAAGVPWDLRKSMPYLAYDQVDFDVIVGTVGDTFDRYAVRMNEIRESLRIVRQIVEKMPAGDYRVQDKKVTPPPRARIDESMEALIHHFKLFTRGLEPVEGEVYQAVESPRGELGCYLVSNGSNKPWRLHVRGPSFVNIQSVPAMLRGRLVADAIAILSSVDPVLGEVDR